MEDRAAFNMTTSGPSPMTPKDYSASQVNQPNVPGSGTGWQAERGLGPQPGIDLIDRMVENATARERAQAHQPDLMQALMTMSQQQTQIIAALAALVSRMEDAPKKAPKDKP
jgi:hypothetical protein